ncbi:CaiB/BaiF CoA transferase family protein [Nitratireductor luteus]|uniref:CaiB/BaiF CoA transferase family protein n=1 Tax=Nitratireductor luteus TaxID=2976980 RepID=UPI002240DC65|nr:CoA transferase [Nitratireductor luteus]
MLSDIIVLDLTTSVAGPYAGMMLGDMGAEVIKIERPGGDDTRSWGPPFHDGEALWFLSVNRNKKSVVLDLTNEQARDVLYDFVDKADIVLVNTPPRVSRKLGLDDQTLRTRKPDLIYVSITGFGMEGARADWPCYDLIAEGYSGIMDMTGEADGTPQKIGAPAADLLAGQDAAYAALSALIRRGRTRQGATIDIALVDSMTRFLNCQLVSYLGSGIGARRSGGKDSVIAVYQAFETADNPITIGLGNDNIWSRFWQALGEPEYGADERFRTNSDRRAFRPEIVAKIQGILKTKGAGHWLEFLRQARIPVGPINSLGDVVRDPQLLERGLFYRLRSGNGTVPQVGNGIRIDGRANIARTAPPRTGEHTESAFREILNYDPGKLARLRAADII